MFANMHAWKKPRVTVGLLHPHSLERTLTGIDKDVAIIQSSKEKSWHENSDSGLIQLMTS